MAKIRKLKPEERAKAQTPTYDDADFQAAYPSLFEYMTTIAYEDGSPRKASSVTMFVQDGMMKATLRDPDNARVLWASGESFHDLLETLELMAGSEDTIWRAERELPGDAAKRIKR